MPDGVIYERKNMTISIDEYHDLVYNLGRITAELEMYRSKYYEASAQVTALKNELMGIGKND